MPGHGRAVAFADDKVNVQGGPARRRPGNIAYERRNLDLLAHRNAQILLPRPIEVEQDSVLEGSDGRELGRENPLRKRESLQAFDSLVAAFEDDGKRPLTVPLVQKLVLHLARASMRPEGATALARNCSMPHAPVGTDRVGPG